MSQITHLTIPFIYECLIVKPRCRKPSLSFIKDSLNVEIEQSDMPVAMKIGEKEFRWDGERLWKRAQYKNISGNMVYLSFDQLKSNTEDPESFRYSSSNSRSPFTNFWRGKVDSLSIRHKLGLGGLALKLMTDVDLVSFEDLKYRDLIETNKDQVIDIAQKMISNLRVIDGDIWEPSYEPHYKVVAFGIGNNHGNTALFVIDDSPASETNLVYSANCYDLALKGAEEMAIKRKDTDSLPISTNCGNIIEVLIPSSVTVSCNS